MPHENLPRDEPGGVWSDSASPSAAPNRLWAPWRMQYVGGGVKVPGCVFCDLLNANQDVASLILARGPAAFAIMNLFPYNTGHVMIVPNEHLASPDDLPETILLEMVVLRNRLLGAIRMALNPDGFNVGMNLGEAAGAGIATHLHEHIVPRWQGDANFMPVVGSTKVLPELLPVTYAKLRAELTRSTSATEVPIVALSADGTAVLAGKSATLPRVSVPPDKAIWRAVAECVGNQETGSFEILGWGGIDEQHGGAPIIVHRATGVAPSAGGRWIPADQALAGPDGPLLERVRREVELPGS